MLLFQKNDEKKEYTGPSRIGFSFSYSAQLNCSILFGGCKDVDVHLYDHCTSFSIQPNESGPANRLQAVRNNRDLANTMQQQ
jgi:hypothetical protein